MDWYRDYFDQYCDQYKAAVSEREAIGLAIGICPVDWKRRWLPRAINTCNAIDTNQMKVGKDNIESESESG
eukprot:scaffold18841_cov83-Cyclotella_meneghiniana.AAC.11